MYVRERCVPHCIPEETSEDIQLIKYKLHISMKKDAIIPEKLWTVGWCGLVMRLSRRTTTGIKVPGIRMSLKLLEYKLTKLMRKDYVKST